MPIRITCRHCGKKFSAWDDLIGKSVQCPKCQQSMIAQVGGESGSSTNQASGGKKTQPQSRDDTPTKPQRPAPSRPAPSRPAANRPVAPKPKPVAPQPVAPKPVSPKPPATARPVATPAGKDVASKGTTDTADAPDIDDFDDREDLPFGCPNCNAEMELGDDLCNACGFHLILKKVIDMDGIHQADTSTGFDRVVKKHLDESESTTGAMLWFKVGGLFFIVLVCFVCLGPWGLAIGGVLVVAYLIYRAQLRVQAENNPNTHVERDPIAAIMWTSMLRAQRLIGWRSTEPPFGSLSVLTLRDSSFSNEDLGQVEDLKKIEVLDVEGTGITDAGLSHLKGRKKLRFLVVKNTSVTPAGVERLQQSIPAAWIWY